VVEVAITTTDSGNNHDRNKAVVVGVAEGVVVVVDGVDIQVEEEVGLRRNLNHQSILHNNSNHPSGQGIEVKADGPDSHPQHHQQQIPGEIRLPKGPQ
jgi:hypothetical protein